MSLPHDRISFTSDRIVDEPLFKFLVALEVQKSQRLQYSVSVVYLNATVVGNGSTIAPLGQRMIKHLRSTDVVFEFLPSSLAFLLIDAEGPSLPLIVNRLAEHLRGFVKEGETLVWSAGGASYPQTAGTAGELLEQARKLMVRAKEDGGDRLYLAS